MKHTAIFLFVVTHLLGASAVCRGQTASGLVSSTSLEPVSSASPQIARIWGVVQGPKGPLPGVVVQANGTKIMTVSSVGGKFALEVPTSAAMVEVTCSYVGLADVVVKLPTNVASATVKLLTPVARTRAEPVLEEGWW